MAAPAARDGAAGRKRRVLIWSLAANATPCHNPYTRTDHQEHSRQELSRQNCNDFAFVLTFLWIPYWNTCAMAKHRALGYSITHLLPVLLLLTLTLFAIRTEAAGRTLKLGILAPTAGPNQSIGQQIIAGVQIAAADTTDIIGDVVWADWDGNNVKVGLAELQNHQVDVIIVSLAAHRMDQFMQVLSSQKWAVPLVFLALNHHPDSLIALKNFKNVITFGYTYYDFTRLALSTWANHLGLDRPVVLYDTQVYFQELREVSENALKKYSQDGRVRSLPISEFHQVVSDYEDTDGVVLIGHPTQIPKYLEKIQWETDAISVFMTGVYAGSSLGRLSSHNFTGVYHGSIWSAERELEDDQRISQALDEINQHLGWQSHAFSPFALDAYGATKVVEAGWLEWQNQSGAGGFGHFWDVFVDGNGAQTLTDDYQISFSGDVKGMVPGGFLSEAISMVSVPFDAP